MVFPPSLLLAADLLLSKNFEDIVATLKSPNIDVVEPDSLVKTALTVRLSELALEDIYDDYLVENNTSGTGSASVVAPTTKAAA